MVTNGETSSPPPGWEFSHRAGRNDLAILLDLQLQRNWDADVRLVMAPESAIAAFGEGYGSLTGSMLGGYGATFAVMALNFFILTTLDTATRIQRYVIGELGNGLKLPALNNRWTGTAIAVGTALILAFATRYNRNLGIGTLIATMLPYSVALLIGWTVFMLLYAMTGFPLGPGSGYEYVPQ